MMMTTTARRRTVVSAHRLQPGRGFLADVLERKDCSLELRVPLLGTLSITLRRRTAGAFFQGIQLHECVREQSCQG